MVEFEIKLHKEQHTAYIPKELVGAMGLIWRATHHGSVLCAYPKGTPEWAIIDSLKILLRHFELKEESK